MHWLSQRWPSPSSSHCPGVPLELLMIHRELSFLSPVVFTSVWLHTIHHRCTLSPCSHFFFWWRWPRELYLLSCTTAHLLSCIISQLLSCRQELPVHQISPLHNTADTVVHGVIFNTSHVLREEICKRFEAKRFRQVMYLKGVLQQGVPMHSSTKRSPTPFLK